jgi:putative ABC transport system permease protein
MIRALWRKICADVMSNKLQFLLIGCVLSLSSMLLIVSLLLMISADEPWQRTFDATHGPHLWVVSHQADVDFSPLTQDAAVTESSGVMMCLADHPLVLGDEKIPVFLYAMDAPPPVAHPLLAKGQWLDLAAADEIVLDFSLAKYYEFEVGDQITILGADGNHRMQVVGLAVTAHWFPYDEITKDVSPGVAYLSQRALESLQPDHNFWYAVVGVRLKDPQTSKAWVDRVNEFIPGQLRAALEWQYIKQNAQMADTLNAMFMGLFSILGLAAVGMIIVNTIGGQVLSQYREIGLMKAVGFSPPQVSLLLLVEHLTIGLIAGLFGILLSLLIAPGLVGRMAENLNTTPPNIFEPTLMIGVLMVVEIVIPMATLLPACQAGRIDTVQAISLGYSTRNLRVSRFGQLAGKLRLPAVVVLGVKDTFSRPVRTFLAIASLILTIMVAITAVSAQATTNDLARDRYYFNGTSADLRVERNFVPYEILDKEVSSGPEVMSDYEELLLYAQVPDHSDQPVAVRFLEGDYADFDFHLKEGRMIAAPGEAVMGYAVFKLLDKKIGDRIDILVEGKPMQLTIVGRHMENLNLNNVILISLETYRWQAQSEARPSTFYLRLKNPSQAESLRRIWLDKFQGMINVSVIHNEPVASIVQLKDLIISIAIILMLVAAANLMSTSLLGMRKRVRDFVIIKTLGLTPSQIAISVIVGAVTMAMIALFFGATLGLVVMDQFIKQVGMLIGAGRDFYTIHWGWISLLLPIFVVVAIISSTLPAMRAARLEVTEALRYE